MPINWANDEQKGINNLVKKPRKYGKIVQMTKQPSDGYLFDF